ncbi:MAG TPA: hypothetical protein VMS11_05465 [Solirubrobacterales bacterium]|nr:hypothetical protein [Solirubrobacterales bacterium]
MPKVSEATPKDGIAAKVSNAIPLRVQGIESSLNEMVLKDGREFALEIGGAILPTPTLTRTISGSSSLTLSIHDPDLDFLQSSLAATKLDAVVDGLWFRYVSAELDPPQISLTFEDREVAILREKKGPVSFYRKDMTRAEFVVHLVRTALPRAPIFCPQLHVVQPIETKRQAKKAKDEAVANRGKGFGDTKGLTMDGAPVSKSQIELGDTALRIADSVEAPFICRVAVIAALMAESSMGAAEPDNVLEALGEPDGAPIGTAEEEISGFLTGKPKWTGTTAIGYHKAHPTATFYQIAQAVQKSAFADGSNYAKFGDEARNWVETWGGGEFSLEGGSESVTEPYKFAVGANEDYWSAIKRLAKEVNWRAFFIAGRFFFIDEIELFRGMPRLAIDRDTPAIEKVTGSWTANRPGTDISITAYAGKWNVPPGAVVTLAEYGPFSIGFGDAPLKKGQKIGLSSNRKAKTGEGRARYLVESIESPLRDSDVSDLKQITIKLRKPTAPLPEPAASKRTRVKQGTVRETEGEGGGAPEQLEKMIAEIERIDAKHYPYSSPGSRGTPPPADGPYDCSGFVSRVLYVGGFLDGTLASEELSQAFESGPGEWVTVISKGPNGPTGHAFMRIRTPGGWRYAGTSGANPNGGAGWVPDSEYSSSYLAEFQRRHPNGF